MGTNTLVSSRSIQTSSLHANLPAEWHIYGVPFSVAYGFWVYVYLFKYDEWLGSSEFTLFTFILMAAFHALTFLVCQWSVDAKALLTCKKVSDPYVATVIKIIPVAHQGAAAMCKIEKMVVDKNSKKMYLYEEDKKRFVKLSFPYMDGKPITYFRKWKGLTSQATIKDTIELYGENRFDIPIPSFGELFKEHAVAPFFVFQLFCVMLWFLDEMWYYSMFTLVMLFVFESTVVFQRLRNLQEFRAMSIKPYPINVFRENRWIEIQTDHLLPGDICSVLRSNDDCPVPADLLVLDGSCIANEAMLSGESTPQLKESTNILEPEDVFDIDNHKNNVLFGGTKILQVTAPTGEVVPQAPDGGCIAYVLRTGFSTQQGKLVRTIIYSTERITANNLESLLFILFLLIFAIAAAAYVWIEGTKNEERKRSKVLLDCILIITSVVPPELPMELSLAVNNSLIALAQAYVFCTEPFRIPFAGKVDVACFDKTGTLTAENLLVEGITGLQGDGKELVKPTSAPKETIHVMAAAHALVQLDDGVIGDPMEKNTVESVEWTVGKNDTMFSKKTSSTSIKILRRFPFSSALKRMSTISILSENNSHQFFIAVKGAPETLRNMYTDLPKNYDDIYKYWARRGSRVLALGCKTIANMSQDKVL
ncbi:hypothetical protein HDU76_002479, partial [Blyttiomyces sp. JEL0837]